MFTRNATTDFMPPEPLKADSSAGPNKPPAARAPSLDADKSVISNGLKIIGQSLRIISRGTLQVDGEVEGDVGGAEIIIGEEGKVTGTVAAERVIVRGGISGVIRGVTVALQSSARVEGDIHHLSLVIEERAEFDGRCRRPTDDAGAPARFGRRRLDAKPTSARQRNPGYRSDRLVQSDAQASAAVATQSHFEGCVSVRASRTATVCEGRRNWPAPA
jgi:cytoskeletal protein CcmA (bactofilin family)